MPLRDVLVALLSVSILGANFVAIKVGLAGMPPLLLTGLRFLFAAVPAVFVVGRPDVPARHVVAFGLALGVAQFGLLYTAIGLGMPAGLSSLVIQMQVFFTAALALIVLGERPSGLQVCGGLVAACGIAAIGVSQASGTSLLPVLLVLGAALAWGIANIVTKVSRPASMLSFMVWASLVAPLPLFGLSLAFEGASADALALGRVGWATVGSIAFQAYPTTLLAFALWTGLLSRYPASVVTPFGFLVPVVGIASTRLVFGEALGPLDVLGAVLVAGGLACNLAGSRRAALRARLALCPSP